MKQKPFDLRKYISENKFQTGLHKETLKESFHDPNGKPIGVDAYHRPVKKVNEYFDREFYSNVNKQKSMKIVENEFNKGNLHVADNSKAIITIEKWDKVKYDVEIKYEY